MLEAALLVRIGRTTFINGEVRCRGAARSRCVGSLWRDSTPSQRCQPLRPPEQDALFVQSV